MSDEYPEMCDEFTNLLSDNEVISGNSVFKKFSPNLQNKSTFSLVIKSGFNLEERRPKKKGWKSII